MIQLNLLPDVKQEYLKAKVNRRLIFLGSMIVIIASVVWSSALFTYVSVAQRKHISDLDKDVNVLTAQLQSVKDLERILTVQQQLESLPALHDKKPVIERLFRFMSQMTPKQVGLTRIAFTAEGSKIEIEGSAPSLADVNTFVDTIKFSTYTQKESTSEKRAFSKTDLKSVNKTDAGATFVIQTEYDPTIFEFSSYALDQDGVALIVRDITTTRSNLPEGGR